MKRGVYMPNFRKQFNKGVMELAVLKLINEGDQYGYSIIQEINKRSDNKIEIKDGTLYPILYRLEDQHYIESYWQSADKRGKPRKFYKMTDIGKKRYQLMLSDYNEVSAGIKKILDNNEVK
jgi:PadR family transcriptional regulator PadR